MDSLLELGLVRWLFSTNFTTRRSRYGLLEFVRSESEPSFTNYGKKLYLLWSTSFSLALFVSKRTFQRKNFSLGTVRIIFHTNFQMGS